MDIVVKIIEEIYPSLPMLPGNFRDKTALLKAVNERLLREGAAAIEEEALNEVILRMAPKARFEENYLLNGRERISAVRMIYAGCGCVPTLSGAEKQAVRGRIAAALAAHWPESDGWYNQIELGPVLKEAGFDYKAIGFRTMTEALQELFEQKCRTEERSMKNKQPQRFIHIPIGQPTVSVAVAPVEAEPIPFERAERFDAVQMPPHEGVGVVADRATVCREVCRIMKQAMPQQGGCYSMTRFVPVLRAAGFDMEAYGFKRVKDFLKAFFGDDFRMEDRGCAGRPNMFALLAVDKYAEGPGKVARADVRPTTVDLQTAAGQPGTSAPAKSPASKKKRQSAFSKMMDFAFFRSQGGENGWSAAIRQLADTALRENWYYGATNPGSYPILNNYLLMTFERLLAEDKAHENDPAWKPKIRVRPNDNEVFYVDRWKDKVRTRLYPERVAVFNTGLVDHLYEPIYAVFHSNLKKEDGYS